MADVNVLDLTQATPGSDDSLILFDRNTGEAKSTRYDTLKTSVLDSKFGDSSPTAGQELSYDPATGKYKNTSQIASLKETLTQQINENDAKNLLPIESDLCHTRTINGVTFTVNDDYTVTLNGTSSGDINTFYFCRNTRIDLTGMICACEGITMPNVYFNVQNTDGTAFNSYANHSTEELRGILNYVRFWIESGVTFSNVTLKPMICLKSVYDLDHTYAPPAKTNQQLAKETTGLIDNQNTDGCKNHFRMPWSDFVKNGITYQDNGDGTITANGTVTSSPSYSSNPKGNITGLVVGETYVLSGLPDPTTISGGSSAEAYIKLYKNDWTYREINTRGNKTLTFTYDGTNAMCIDIGIRGVGTVATNAVFKPMICLKSLYDADPTFAPYAKSNKELTDDVVTNNKLVEVQSGIATVNSGIRYDFTNATYTFHINPITRRAMIRFAGITTLTAMASGESRTALRVTSDSYFPPIGVYGTAIIKLNDTYYKGYLSKNTGAGDLAINFQEAVPIGANINGYISWDY